MLPLLENELNHIDFFHSANNSTTRFIVNGLGFTRENQFLKSLVQYNSWEFDVVGSTTGDSVGQVFLWNQTRTTAIAASAIEFNSNERTLGVSKFSDGITGMTSTANGERVLVALSCTRSCDGSNQIRVHKAGLWIKLNNLTKALTPIRIATQKTLSPGQHLFDSTRFRFTSITDSPISVNLRSVVQMNLLNSIRLNLVSSALLDSGTGVVSPIVTSESLIDNQNGQVTVSSLPFSLLSNQRHFLEVQFSGPDLQILDSQIILKIDP